MHIRKSILVTFIVLAAILPSCKKDKMPTVNNNANNNTNKGIDSVAAIDSIVGVYVGDMHYYTLDAPRSGSSSGFDTVIFNDTVFVTKGTKDSFFFYRPSAAYSPYMYAPAESLWPFDSANRYDYYGKFTIIFFPLKDSLENTDSSGYTSGVLGEKFVWMNFGGKKIK